VTPDRPDPDAPAAPQHPAGESDVDPVEAMSEVALQTRRAVLPAVVIGVVALIIGFVIGQPLGGIGVCIGLGLGMLNARMLQDSVQRRFEILVDSPGTKTHFLSSGAVRLALITLVTLGIVILIRPLGFGILIGLAIFQLTMIGFAAVAMYKAVRA